MKYAREEAINRIREFLISKQRDDETTCQTASRLGIFCRGYDKWSTQQLRDMYPWLAKKVPADLPREELLKLIVAWDGARMLVHNVPLTCDAKALERESCLGFERFSSKHLQRLFPQLFEPDDIIDSR